MFFRSRCITFALSRCSGDNIIEAVWNIMNGWYSRVDETPWERRKERSLGTETGKFITEPKSDSGNKGEIPEGERWKTAEDSVSSKRSESADVLCRKENCVCRPATESSHWPPVQDWDDGRTIRQRWGWGERIMIKDPLHVLRGYTCPFCHCKTPGGGFTNSLWFLPWQNPLCNVLHHSYVHDKPHIHTMMTRVYVRMLILYVYSPSNISI